MLKGAFFHGGHEHDDFQFFDEHGAEGGGGGEGLDVTSARIETLGADAVDSFYVANPSGSPVDEAQRRRVETALVEATQGAVPVDTPG